MADLTFKEMGAVVERATTRIGTLHEELMRLTAERDLAIAIATAAKAENARLLAELEAMTRQLGKVHV